MMSLKRTPLYDSHIKHGAQMVDFGGFALPVRFVGDIKEHLQVRQAAGLFDVSHMGEIFLCGKKACVAADRLLTNDISSLQNGKAAYACMLNENGGIVDDVIAYKFSNEKILICINAGNRDKDWQWISQFVEKEFKDTVSATSESDNYAQIALQGPSSIHIIARLNIQSFLRRDNETGGNGKIDNILSLGRFSFMDIGDIIIARTGYTGEDGFELYLPPDRAPDLWEKLLLVGQDFGLIPCGLGARDTLRLEAGMCLYGNDIDESTSPLEAGISFAVKMGKQIPFIGQDALLRQKEFGIARKLCGLEILGKGIARHDHVVEDANGTVIGKVTSGTITPSLQRAIALAYLQKPYFEIGETVYVDVRGRKLEARVTKLPFYSRRES